MAEHADRLLSPGAGILLAQNGIGAEPTYAAVAPGREVLGGLAFLCAQRTGPRSVAHLDFGALTIAAHAPDDVAAGITPLMRAVAEDLTAARTPALLDEDLIRARWRKLLWNIGFNPLSVILDATTDELMADPGTVALIRTLMTEVAAAAAAEGRELPDEPDRGPPGDHRPDDPVRHIDEARRRRGPADGGGGDARRATATGRAGGRADAERRPSCTASWRSSTPRIAHRAPAGSA